MIRSSLRILALAALILLVGGCSALGSTTPTPTATSTVSAVIRDTPEAPDSDTPTPAKPNTPAALDLSGTWNGTWQDTSPDTATGSFTLTWKQSGPSLSGTITINNSSCVSTGTISGNISGAKITFGAVKSQDSVSFNGTISGGDKIMGTYVTGSSCHNATGTWAAMKQ